MTKKEGCGIRSLTKTNSPQREQIPLRGAHGESQVNLMRNIV